MRLRLAITLFFLLSGGTALVYQVIWVRMLGLVVGHSVLAISTVVATYMAGLGLGARLAGGRATRDPRPLRTYGLLELCIGAFALASPAVLGLAERLVALGDPLSASVGPTLLVGALALLPPTLAMGATLPLLTAWYARDGRTLGRDMGWLYAVNTTGAFIGAGLAGFVLLPRLGQPTSLYAAAAINLAVGAAAVALGQIHARGPAPAAPTARPTPSATPARPVVRWRVLLAFALSGGAALIDQVAWSRAFALFTGSTTYAFSLIVCAFIAGLALGGHVFSRVVDRSSDRVGLLARLNLGIALTSALLIPVLGELPLWLLGPLADRAGSFGATVGFVFAVVFALVLVPTVLMGGTYAVATRALSDTPDEAPEQVGRAYAWNTAGAILGSLGAGLLLIPLVQLAGTLWLAVVLNLLAVAVLLAPRRRWTWAVPACGLVALGAGPDWNPRHMNLAPHIYASELVADPAQLREFRDSGSVLFHEEGIGATVTVIQRQSGARVLRINGKTDASSETDRLTQGILGSLPVLLAEDPGDVLVIGLGSGMTLATALEFPVERVRAVELLPEVVRASRAFDDLLGQPLDDDRTELVIGDGRHVLRAGDRRYGVISSEPTNLFISGMSTLFTRETFEAMREALEPGGVALVWLQGYLLRDEDFRTVVRTFREVFPEAHLWSASPHDLALTGHLAPLAIDGDRVARRLAALETDRVTSWTGLRSPLDLQRHYLLGPASLEALAGPGPIQEDRDPFLEFTAPRALFGSEGLLAVEPLVASRELLPLSGAPDSLLQRRREAARAVDLAALAGDHAALERAVEADPGHAFGQERLARLLHVRALARAQEGDRDGAIADLRRVLALAPRSLASWRLLAALLREGGDTTGALHVLREAIEHQPWNPYAHLSLSLMAADLGQPQLAALARAKAAALDPELPEL